jgi:hypothetical protein
MGNKTRKSKQKGGVTIASGGYGCVFEIDANTVGKINFVEPMWMEHDGMTFDKFMAIQSAIRAIDPDEKYFITIRDATVINVNDDRVKECFANWATKASPVSIRKFKNAAPSTVTYYSMTRVEPTNVRDWSEAQWRHALAGMNLLHKNNICHHDIHAGNFGLKGGMPVYIDMDGAGYAREPSLSINRNGVKDLALYDTIETDTLNFRKMLEKSQKAS